ncbi:DUF2489 domain-containing protein [Aliiglaciecola litoralis]|uniref:DUF2489 domain-containing protein n=1 Tax=Aliiglaciecola litoralis TaxID=582857 RepID=A0ABN1LTG3_9ALTE
MSFLSYVVIAAAATVIAGLSFYAGKLLYQVKQQTKRQSGIRQARIERIMESVHTIALAVEQQQCNLSEGAIRLVNLIDSIPVESPPNCQRDYPALYQLFLQVRELPTHDARDQLDKKVKAKQDKVREEHESRLESEILKEIAHIRTLDYR